MSQSEIDRQKDIETTLSVLAAGLDEVVKSEFGAGMGFALLVFDYGQPSIGHYVSSAKREDMIKALRETADRIEKRQDIPPAIGKA